MEFNKITVYFKKLIESPDVIAMSPTERSGYVWLLFNSINQNNKGYVINNERLLCTLSGLSMEDWLQSKSAILKKFKLCNEKGYYHPVMLKEVEKNIQILKNKYQSRIAKTKNIQSANNKAIDNNGVGQGIGQGMDKGHHIDRTGIELRQSSNNQPNDKIMLNGHSPHNQPNDKKHKLQLYIENPRCHLESVRKIKNQLTYEQCVELVGDLSDPTDMGKPFTTKLVKEKLFKMENTMDVEKKYPSLFLTLQQWCDNELKGKTYAKAK